MVSPSKDYEQVCSDALHMGAQQGRGRRWGERTQGGLLGGCLDGWVVGRKGGWVSGREEEVREGEKEGWSLIDHPSA